MKAKALLLFGLLLCFYTPKFLGPGLYSDGLVYAILGRNLSLGEGSFWSLRFLGERFTDHPPLYPWILSLFFRVLGDAWWVEKFAGAGFLIGTLALAHSFACRCRAWMSPAPLNSVASLNLESRQRFATSALVIFLLSPFCLQWIPCLQLEIPLLFFCLLSLWAQLNFLGNASASRAGWASSGWGALAGLSLVAAFLVKGPTSLFVVVAPLWLGFLGLLDWRRVGVLMLWLLVLPLLLLLAWHAVDPIVGDFFRAYLLRQVWSSMQGERTNVASEWGRLQVLVYLWKATLPWIGVTLLLWRVRVKARIVDSGTRHEWSAFRFFALVALSSSLPLMLSRKLHPYYVLPSLLFFSFAIAELWSLWLGRLLPLRDRLSSASRRFGGAVALALCLMGLVLSFVRAGSVVRDPDHWRLVVDLQRQLRDGESLGVDAALARDWTLVDYLSRFVKDPARDGAPADWLITQGVCPSEMNSRDRYGEFALCARSR